MLDPAVYRRVLSARVLGIVGAASLMAPSGACRGSAKQSSSATAASSASSTTSAVTTSSASGATTASSGTGMGGAGGAGGGTLGPVVVSCFDLPATATACPTDTTAILTAFLALGCPTGWEPLKVLSGPMTNAMNQCCYSTELRICSAAGRPFTSPEGALLSPTLQERRAWSDGAPPSSEALSSDERASLAQVWAEDAAMEHASVASFGRLSLSLLALGAPSSLVERTHRAALDEVAHARLAYALASGYAGRELGPGPFPLGSSVELERTLVGLAASAVREGAIMETIGAVMAAEARSLARDPAVRATLDRIAEDEADHACLAWETIAWAISEGGPLVRDAVREAFVSAFAAGIDAPPQRVSTPTLEQHGRLGHDDRARAIQRAMNEIIAQC